MIRKLLLTTSKKPHAFICPYDLEALTCSRLALPLLLLLRLALEPEALLNDTLPTPTLTLRLPCLAVPGAGWLLLTTRRKRMQHLETHQRVMQYFLLRKLQPTP